MATIFRREWDYLMNQFGDKDLGLFYVDTKDQIKDVYGEIVGGKTYLIKASTMRGILITDPLTLKQFADWVQIDQPVVFKVSSTDLLNSGVLDANFNYEYADDPDTTVIEGILNHKYIRWKGEFYDVVGVQKALVYKGETSALYFVTQKNLSWETLAGKSTLVVQDDTPIPPTPVEYTVTVDDVVKGQYTPGTLVTLTTPTKEGFVFKGWSSSEVTVTNGSFIMPDGNVTVTSVWEQEVTPDPTFNVTIDGVLLGAYVAGALVNINAGTKEGYTFAGWTAPSSVTLADPSAAATTFTMPSEEVVLTTNWTEVPVTTYNVYLSGTLYGQYAAGALVTVTAPEFEDVYQERGFNHWETVPDLPIDTTSRSISFTMPSQDVYLTPVYAGEEIDYWVVTVLGVNGDTSTQGVPMTVTKGQAVSLSAGTKSGYNFSGWTIEGSGVGVFGDASSADTTFTPSTDVTVKANWTVIVPEDYFVITYVGIAGLTTQTVKAGTKVNINAGSKEGYTFNGWTADPSVTFSSQSVYSSFTMPSNDVTITANWTIQTFTLSVVLVNGSEVFTQTYDYNTQVTLSTLTLDLPTGVTANGFYDTATMTNVLTTVDMNMNVTVYVRGEVVVTLDIDGEVSTQYNLYGSAVSGLPTPTKEGYAFSGWTLDGDDYDLSTPVTAPITLVAVFVEAGQNEWETNALYEVDLTTENVYRTMYRALWKVTDKATSGTVMSYNQHSNSNNNTFGTANENLSSRLSGIGGRLIVGATVPAGVTGTPWSMFDSSGKARVNVSSIENFTAYSRYDGLPQYNGEGSGSGIDANSWYTAETRDHTVTQVFYIYAKQDSGADPTNPGTLFTVGGMNLMNEPFDQNLSAPTTSARNAVSYYRRFTMLHLTLHGESSQRTFRVNHIERLSGSASEMSWYRVECADGTLTP